MGKRSSTFCSSCAKLLLAGLPYLAPHSDLELCGLVAGGSTLVQTVSIERLLEVVQQNSAVEAVGLYRHEGSSGWRSRGIWSDSICVDRRLDHR